MKERQISDKNVVPHDRACFWETIFKYRLNHDAELIDPDGNLIITSIEKAAELMARWEEEALQGGKR